MEPVICNFCGEPRADADVVWGPAICICRDCVKLCCDMLAERAALAALPATAEAPETDGTLCENCEERVATGRSLDDVPLCDVCGRGLEAATAEAPREHSRTYWTTCDDCGMDLTVEKVDTICPGPPATAEAEGPREAQPSAPSSGADLEDEFGPHNNGTHHLTEDFMCLECTLVATRARLRAMRAAPPPREEPEPLPRAETLALVRRLREAAERAAAAAPTMGEACLYLDMRNGADAFLARHGKGGG